MLVAARSEDQHKNRAVRVYPRENLGAIPKNCAIVPTREPCGRGRNPIVGSRTGISSGEGGLALVLLDGAPRSL